MRHLIEKCILLATALFLAACNKTPQEAPAPEVKAEPTSLQFESTSDSRTVRLTSNCSWTLRTEAGWISFSPTSGKEGTTPVNVKAAGNTDTKERSAKLQILVDGKALLEIPVTQQGAKADPQPEPEPEPQPDPEPQPGETPVADLLDIVFKEDGTAEDVSPAKMQVETLPGAQLSTYYHEAYKRQVAHFNNDMGKTVSSGYYKIDYSGNADFKNRIADSHTWETVVRIDKDPTGFGEIKFFTATQSGGTGFLVSKATDDHHNTFAFIPNTGSWNWAESDIVPVPGRYYHLVGIFDAAAQKAEIYIDGVCKSSIQTSSSTFKHASDSYQYIVVGGDPGSGGCTNSWLGDIVVARIYDKALTASEVKLLYEREKIEQSDAAPILSDLQFLGECAVSPGMKYHIYGKGFQAGDKVRFSQNSSGQEMDAVTVISAGEAVVTIPAGIVAGVYTLSLVRGNASAPIGTVSFTRASSSHPRTQVVAHRGAYKNTGAAQNSIAALKAVKPLGIYGSELDVWITPDDVVVVNHDATFPTDSKSRYITDTNYSELGDIRLSNGEVVPTLEEYIKTAKAEGIRLIIEIKTQRASANGSHTKRDNNNRVVDASIALVRKYGFESMCDWIAFDYENCRRIAAALPGACVQYLNGDLAPAVCHADGVNGIDYKMDKLTYSWVEAAHQLDMVVNVWTVDSSTDILKYIGWGVDFITTNQPELAKELTEKVFLEY